MAKKDSSYADFGTQCGAVISGIISIGIAGLFSIFPLIYHDTYNDILEIKYQCYYLIALTVMAVSLLAVIVAMLKDASSYNGTYTKEWLEKWKSRKIFKVFERQISYFVL